MTELPIPGSQNIDIITRVSAGILSSITSFSCHFFSGILTILAVSVNFLKRSSPHGTLSGNLVTYRLVVKFKIVIFVPRL